MGGRGLADMLPRHRGGQGEGRVEGSDHEGVLVIIYVPGLQEAAVCVVVGKVRVGANVRGMVKVRGSAMVTVRVTVRVKVSISAWCKNAAVETQSTCRPSW